MNKVGIADTPVNIAALCETGSGNVFIAETAPLAAVIDAFHAHPATRLLPVVDPQHLRPVGAIAERDIRDLLFNPFGHALLRNPGYGQRLNAYCRACPIMDVNTPLAELLDSVALESAAEGVILTSEGKLHGVLSNRTLLYLAGRREAELMRHRSLRIDRIEQSSATFRNEATQLADMLATVANEIEGMAALIADRAAFDGERASAVAGASAQTQNGMHVVAARGRELATAIDRIDETTRRAHSAASEAVLLVETGSQRTSNLDSATRSIDAALESIRGLASRAQLLAINASIEAARMGDAGSGFTVVAREVRQFSAETKLAAGEITARVEDIRIAAQGVIAGHGGIKQVVDTIDAIADSVNEAVGTQLDTMRFFTDNVDQVTGAGDEIQSNVMEISRAASAAADAAQSMRQMAQSLSGKASSLRQKVDDYVGEMRAA